MVEQFVGQNALAPDIEVDVDVLFIQCRCVSSALGAEAQYFLVYCLWRSALSFVTILRK
jgi:hypothetical protein